MTPAVYDMKYVTKSYNDTLSIQTSNALSFANLLFSRVADPGEVVTSPDLYKTVKKNSETDPTLEKKPRIWIRNNIFLNYKRQHILNINTIF